MIVGDTPDDVACARPMGARTVAVATGFYSAAALTAAGVRELGLEGVVGMRGRVNGTITSGAWIAIPLGMLIAGFVSEQFGVITTIVAIAAAYLLVTLSIFLNPAMREMDRVT